VLRIAATIALAAALMALAALASPARAHAQTWRWPVNGAVITGFRTVADPFARGQHRGIDIAAAPGTAVRSACAGRVAFAGAAASAGRTVTVRCGGLTASYLHLSRLAVRRGERVRPGARLGAAGLTGRPSSPAPHVHFGVRRAPRDYVDPLALLGADPGLPAGPGPIGFAPRARPGAPAAPGGRVRPRIPDRRPAPRPVVSTPRPVAVTVFPRDAPGLAPPPLALLGAGLVVLALPGWGVSVAGRRRRRRAAAAVRPLRRRARGWT